MTPSESSTRMGRTRYKLAYRRPAALCQSIVASGILLISVIILQGEALESVSYGESNSRTSTVPRELKSGDHPVTTTNDVRSVNQMPFTQLVESISFTHLQSAYGRNQSTSSSPSSSSSTLNTITMSKMNDSHGNSDVERKPILMPSLTLRVTTSTVAFDNENAEPLSSRWLASSPTIAITSAKVVTSSHSKQTFEIESLPDRHHRKIVTSWDDISPSLESGLGETTSVISATPVLPETTITPEIVSGTAVSVQLNAGASLLVISTPTGSETGLLPHHGDISPTPAFSARSVIEDLSYDVNITSDFQLHGDNRKVVPGGTSYSLSPKDNQTEHQGGEHVLASTSIYFVLHSVSSSEDHIVISTSAAISVTAGHALRPSSDSQVAKDESSLPAGTVAGIVIASVGLVVILAIGAGLYVFKRFHGLGHKTYDNKFTNDNCSYLDSLQVSYINSHTELPKESSDELFSLDNDSFLNSLEAMTMENYWADSRNSTKV